MGENNYSFKVYWVDIKYIPKSKPTPKFIPKTDEENEMLVIGKCKSIEIFLTFEVLFVRFEPWTFHVIILFHVSNVYVSKPNTRKET